MNKNRGFTLVELIVVIALISMIIGTAGSMITFSFRAQKTVSDEFQIQSDMRLASEVVNEEVRHATAIFLLNGNQFKSSGDLKEGWDYFALSDDNKQIVHYKWNGTSHTTTPLVNLHAGLNFGLNFKSVHGNARVVEFNLSSYLENSMTPKVTISTMLNALNSVVVDDSGSLSSPSVALAYRAENIPESEQMKVAVTMILDRSGSMGENIGGGDSNKRDTTMIAKAQGLIDLLNDIDNVHVSLIPFNNLANANDFLTVKKNLVNLKTTIGGYNHVNNTGTNAGDGLRRSYYKHVDFAKNNPNVLHYTILLMDGNPTYWVKKSNVSYYDESNDGIDKDGTGYETLDNLKDSKKYIENLATNTIKKSDTPLKNMKTFTIGFSGISSDVSNAQEISGYFNIVGSNDIKSSYYFANNTQSLENAFRSIVDSILEDTWHIYGPNN